MNIHYGDWNIVRKIGSGSFGTVYEIERESFGFCQKAALKVISIPQSQNDVASIRNTGMDEASIGDYYRDLASEIVKELQTMEQLKGHTNIVSYEDHEIRPKSEGLGWEIYIRMELLTPLQTYLSEHQMNRDEVIRLGIDLCRALERCESLNIIHRDIKPDNIFLSKQGDGKLGDFGIARSAERTMSGMSRKGTFGFMAPEVYKGQPYGKTVDIYSLGLVLYRLLNYNRGPFLPPYPDPIKYQDQTQALARRIQGETLSAPAQADPRLAEVVLKACSYDPKQRFSTAEEMRLALEAARGVASNEVTAPVQLKDGELELLPELYDDATICGGSSLTDDRAEGTFPEPEGRDELVRDDTFHSSDQEELPLRDEGTVSPFRRWGDFAPTDKQIQDEVTAFVLNESPSNEKVTAEDDGKPVRRPTVADENTVSVFNPIVGQSAIRGAALADEGTVSIFGQPKMQNQSREASNQTAAPKKNENDDWQRSKQQEALRQKERQEEEERAKKEEAEKKKRKIILLAVAAVLIVLGAVAAVRFVSQSKTASMVEDTRQMQSEEQPTSAPQKVEITTPNQTLNVKDGESTRITIRVDSHGIDYDMVAEYPKEYVTLRQEADSGFSRSYTITPTLPDGKLNYRAELVFKAVSKNQHEEVYSRRVITVNISAEDDTVTEKNAVVVPDVVGNLCDYAYWRLAESGLKPVLQFSEYQRGKIAEVVAQDPKAETSAHSGDKVTVTLAGWKRDDIQLSVGKAKVKLKVGKKTQLKVRISGNLPDAYSLDSMWLDGERLQFDWGDYVDSNECEFYLTALEPIKHEVVLITLTEDGDEDASAGTVFQISASK